MGRIRRALPLVVSVGLILALGMLVVRSSGRAEHMAEAVHRTDNLALQENLAGLTDQYLLVAAKELLDFGVTSDFDLADGAAARAEMEALLKRSAFFNHGVVITDLSGDVREAVALGPIPDADDPALEPIRAGLLRGKPGVSSVVIVDGVPLVGIGVPLSDGIGFPKAIVVGLFRPDTSELQKYNEKLRNEPGTLGHVVDSRGTVVTSTDITFVGRSLASHPAFADGRPRRAGILEFRSGDEEITSLVQPMEIGGWSLVKDVPTSEFSGPIRNSRKQHELLLVGLLAAAALALVLLNHRGEASQRRSEARFRSLVQNTSDIITVTDRDGRILYDSPAVEHVLGFSPQERIGTLVSEYVHPDRTPWVEEMAATLQASGEPVVRGELPIRRHDGGYCWLEVTATNMLHDPGVGGIVINQRDVSERVALHRQLSHQAYHDALTGLPNRTLFNERLDGALAGADDERRMAVLFVDLDRFKMINDNLGHHGGDLLLVEVARRLSRVMRKEDTLARISGDEFSILLVDADEEQATRVAERLLEELRLPFAIQGHDVVVGASVGIALSEAGQQPEDLLRHADLAMYRAKERGRLCFQIFESDLGDRSRQRLELEADLRRALDHGELALHYQPEVDLATDRVTGFEALIRWHHPTRGLLQPSQFLPLAEETGLIVPIGDWVLHEACRQVAEWRAQHPDQAVRVNVNVSNRQLQQPGLVTSVTDALAAHAVSPSALVIELTEGVLMEDPEATIMTLDSLRDLGVELAIDDFGTGYSSLSYLKHFPISTLKLDRSFVLGICDDASDAAIAGAIVNLAHSLGVAVTAEGVELAGQLQALRDLRCDRAQGFYFARPMPASDAWEVLEAQAAAPTLDPH
jgi:diguanylate cyclase (GGDEF)-like protein/PAS domain S-box-containing protein